MKHLLILLCMLWMMGCANKHVSNSFTYIEYATFNVSKIDSVLDANSLQLSKMTPSQFLTNDSIIVTYYLTVRMLDNKLTTYMIEDRDSVFLFIVK